jgi:uncharacterized surface protein with fasciclin (FAS1) repeats
MHRFVRTSSALALLLVAAPLAAQARMARSSATVMVGTQAMSPSKDIVDNAVNSADHTTLVAAVKAAGLVETLKGKGPFTVFAPVNTAFAALPAGTVDNLLKPENKAALTGVLTYHVVAGTFDAAAIERAIRAGHGTASLKTVAGGTLTGVLTYHVVAGTFDAAAIERAIRAGHGTASLKTVAGGTLTAMMNGPRNIVVKDAQGNVASVSTYDVRQSNGVIHVIDRVLLPNM